MVMLCRLGESEVIFINVTWRETFSILGRELE